jgi:hypothetical protein
MLDARLAMGELMGRKPTILGGLMTHWGEETSSQAAEGRLQIILNTEGSKVLDVKIPMSSVIESNPNAARNAKQAYDELVTEVMNNVSNG